MSFNKLAFLNIWRDKWTYFAYFLSSTFSVLIFFLFSISMFHPELNAISSGSSLSLAMGAGNILIYLFSFIFISYSVGAFLRNRQKVIGIFILNGASKRQINRMIFVENMIIGISSIVLALLLGLALSPLSLLASKKVLGVEEFRMYFPIIPILITTVLFLILFLLISSLTPKFIRKEKILSLLKSEKKDENNTIPLIVHFVGLLSLFVLSGIILFERWDLLDNSYGFFIVLILGLFGLYFIIAILGKLLLISVTKTKGYYRKTNLLLFAELKSKYRGLVNTIFIVSALLIGVFSAITMLYGMRNDVEAKALENYIYSYTYIVADDTINSEEKLESIRGILSNKEGYEEISFDVKMIEDSRSGITSQSNYNISGRVLGLDEVDLRENELLLVAGSNSKDPVIYEDYLTDFNIIDIQKRLITPEGYFSKIVVLEDKIYNSLEAESINLTINAFNVEDWKEDMSTHHKIRELVTDGGKNLQGFFSSGYLFQGEKMAKNLGLYIGGALSIIFVLASISMVYFRLVTEKEREVLKYKNLMKIGLSEKEFSIINNKNIGILMFIPFIIASMFLLALQVVLYTKLNLNFSQISLIIYIVFLGLQILGYVFTKNNYKNTILKSIKER